MVPLVDLEIVRRLKALSPNVELRWRPAQPREKAPFCREGVFLHGETIDLGRNGLFRGVGAGERNATALTGSPARAE